MKRVLRIAFIAIRSILLFILIWGITTTVCKNIQKVILVENFKAKAVFEEEKSTASVKYYRVKSNETRKTYTEFDGEVYPGGESDILVTTESLVGPDIIRNTFGYFVGGHAAYVNGDYGDYNMNYITSGASTIEATGMNPGLNVADVFPSDYWIDSETYKEVIGLRVKMSDEKRREVNSLMSSRLGDLYNYSLLFDTVNKSYCSDLISKSFAEVGININKDGFVTTILDIISSGDCYISYYHIYKDDVKYIYYLG